MEELSNNMRIMSPEKKKSPYSFKVIWNTIRHGLFFQGLRHALAKIGIDIMPYYWVHEEAKPTDEPRPRTDLVFSFKQLLKDDLSLIITETDSINEKKIHESFALGHECVGLLHNDEIAAYMFVEFNDFEIKKRKFTLQDHEAYLLNMYTLPKYRGKSLAPYLRYKCYRYLETKGITTFYSVSNYFNKSAIRFKKKLNSKPLKLYINIELFKSAQWNFTLKSYK